MVGEQAFARRVLVVGCGSIGRRHARILREIGVTRLAVCDPDETRRRAVQMEQHIDEGYADLGEALGRGFAAAWICTPPALHIPQARQALEAGCDVFCEKPLSDSLDGIDALAELVERRDRRFMVGLCFRYHQGLQRVKQAIESGQIGRLIAVRALMAEYLPDCRPGVDYRTLYIAQPGGGVTLDYIHEIDLAQWIVGQPVESVYAVSGQYSDLEMRAADTSEIVMRFRHRAVAEVHLNVFQRVRQRRSEFMGTEGMISIDFADWNRCTIRTYRATEGTWRSEELTTDRDDMFRAENREFLQHVSARTYPQLDVREGTVPLRIALAAIESSAQGRPVAL